jgi:NADH:ubiquinone oxidoreductase subunit E
LQQEPCVKPHEISHPDSAVFYPLERERNNNCSIEIGSGKTHDKRFTKHTPAISEFDLQSTSGVLQTLKSLQESKSYLSNSSIESKKDILNYFYSRSTI